MRSIWLRQGGANLKRKGWDRWEGKLKVVLPRVFVHIHNYKLIGILNVSKAAAENIVALLESERPRSLKPGPFGPGDDVAKELLGAGKPGFSNQEQRAEKAVMFKRKQKIHLSPRLAETIGQRARQPNAWKTRLAAVVVLSTLSLGALSYFKNSEIVAQNSSLAEARGEILGAESATVINYMVESGDTLIKLSQKFNVYWMTIVEENELKAPYNLKPGQILRIPLPRD